MKEFEVINEQLDDFSVIVVKNHSRVRIKKGVEMNKIDIHIKKTDTAFVKPEFIVRNDTLFVENTHKNITPIVRCKKLNAVIVKEKSNIHIEKYPVDSLEVSVSSGKFYLVADKPTEKVKQVKIHAEDQGYLQFDKMYIEEVELSLNHSTVNFQNTAISSVTGSLKNVSKLICYRAIGKMNLDIDSNSSYHLSK